VVHPTYPQTMSILYQIAVAIVRLAAPLFSVGDSKLARGMAGRRHADRLLATWGDVVRDRDRPVVWFHAPSVGEGLQAMAVKDALLEARPDVQVVYTFFSPSAESLAGRFGADVATYLPWDLRGPLTRVLRSVEPSLIVFTKTEVWPVLVAEAGRHGIPVAMVGATVTEGAGRGGRLARTFLRATWATLDLVCANTEADAERLSGLGVRRSALVSTGDPGIDSAASRFDDTPRSAPYLDPFRASSRPTIVAGSTWRSDEDVLLPALRQVRDAAPALRVIIAPHEPHADSVADLVVRLREDGWGAGTLTDVERASGGSGDARGGSGAHGGAARERGVDEPLDAVVVDRVGALAHLYGVAAISYVGGGFHAEGLHSVLEPAAAETPVVFGPRHGNTRAASDLLREGGAKIATSSDELAGVMTEWLLDEELRSRAGQAAVDYIQRHRGAADRAAARLRQLLDDGPSA